MQTNSSEFDYTLEECVKQRKNLYTFLGRFLYENIANEFVECSFSSKHKDLQDKAQALLDGVKHSEKHAVIRGQLEPYTLLNIKTREVREKLVSLNDDIDECLSAAMFHLVNLEDPKIQTKIENLHILENEVFLLLEKEMEVVRDVMTKKKYVIDKSEGDNPIRASKEEQMFLKNATDDIEDIAGSVDKLIRHAVRLFKDIKSSYVRDIEAQREIQEQLGLKRGEEQQEPQGKVSVKAKEPEEETEEQAEEVAVEEEKTEAAAEEDVGEEKETEGQAEEEVTEKEETEEQAEEEVTEEEETDEEQDEEPVSEEEETEDAADEKVGEKEETEDAAEEEVSEEEETEEPAEEALSEEEQEAMKDERVEIAKRKIKQPDMILHDKLQVIKGLLKAVPDRFPEFVNDIIKDTDTETKKIITGMLAKVDNDRMSGVYRNFINHSSTFIRLEGMIGFNKWRPEEARDIIVGCVADQDSSVRRFIANYLEVSRSSAESVAVARLANDKDEGVARVAIRKLGKTKNRFSFINLLPKLESTNIIIRKEAIMALQGMTGTDLRYQYSAPDRQRRQACLRWKKMWEQNKSNPRFLREVQPGKAATENKTRVPSVRTRLYAAQRDRIKRRTLG